MDGVPPLGKFDPKRHDVFGIPVERYPRGGTLQRVLEIDVPLAPLLSLAKSSESSVVPTLQALIGRALHATYDVGERTIVAYTSIDTRRVFGLESGGNAATHFSVPYVSRLDRYDLAKRAMVLRGALDLQTLPENIATEIALNMAGMAEGEVSPYPIEAITAAIEPLVLESTNAAYSYAISYPGKVSLPRPEYGEGVPAQAAADPLPDDATLSYALVGNQNCGKTTLFNQLTGSNQHVGNFPGVTVDRKDGVIRDHPNTVITDLPGIYSFSPYTSEELVSREFMLDEHPLGLINIVDATNIERNLYLTMQCLEMGIPTVVALNMMDELTGNGGSVDVNRMEWMLGVPVVPICAATGEGVEEVVRHAIHVAKHREAPAQPVIDLPGDYDDCLRRCHQAVASVIARRAEAAQLPLRFAASKLIEGDELLAEQLELSEDEQQAVAAVIRQMEKERGLDASAAIADMRFQLIFHICDTCVVKPHESREHQKSTRIDRILTGKWTAIPCFIGIMAAVFVLTFNVIGAWLQEQLEVFIGMGTAAADRALTHAGVSDALHSLVIDGVFAGVGSVLSFMPIILVMFLFLSLLEDSGYLARVAFFMDKPLRRIGLSGRSIVPMLVGFGCAVPAVMSTRTLPSDRDRRMTILLTPFMSCTAKLPIYAFFVAAFFPGQGGLVMTLLYLLGILLGIVVAHFYNRTIFKGDPTPLVIELPNYRIPSAKNTGQLMWEKAKDFLQKAFSVILIATIVVWFLSHFDAGLNLLSDEEAGQSLLAAIAGLLSPILNPVGLGDWRIGTSLISGFMAKESVVAVMEQLYAPMGGVAAVFTTLQAACMLVFALLYTPCVAAMAAIKQELGLGWAIRVGVGMFAQAWGAALVVRLVGQALGVA